MNINSVRSISGITAAITLFLGCMITMVPLRAGAAEPDETTRQVWTAEDAEMQREVAEGVPLKNIINNVVTSGKSIGEVVAAAIKVGVDPSLVVFTAIEEGYAAQTVIQAALQAGASFDTVLNSATHAGLNKKIVYVGNVVTTAIKIGVDPSHVVHSAINEGYPAQIIVKTALKAGAPLDVVVKSALDAGAEVKLIYAGAADAGKSSSAVERALRTAGPRTRTADKPSSKLAEKRSGQPVLNPSTSSKTALTPLFLEPPPAIFGRGVVLTSLPAGLMTPQLIDIGLLKINPFLTLSEAFSDNMFFTANNRTSGSITSITPGVRVKLPFKTHIAELEYFSVITRYGKEFGFDDTSDHHGNAAVDLVFGDRFEMRLSDQLAHDHEPRSSSATRNIEVFDTNAAALSASYRTSNLTRIQIDYTKSDWRYLTGHFRDREEDLFAGTVFYQVLSRTSAFIEYGHRKIAYTDKTLDLDSTVGTLQAGLTWDVTVRTKGTVKAGLERKEFKSSARGNTSRLAGSADVQQDITKDTSLVLTVRRSMNEPDIPGSNYFISTGAYAELTQRLVTALSAAVRGAYVLDDDASRIDRTSIGGIGLKYRAKDWLEFSADYNLHIRHSNIVGNNYSEHSAIIRVDFSL